MVKFKLKEYYALSLVALVASQASGALLAHEYTHVKNNSVNSNSILTRIIHDPLMDTVVFASGFVAGWSFSLIRIAKEFQKQRCFGLREELTQFFAAASVGLVTGGMANKKYATLKSRNTFGQTQQFGRESNEDVREQVKETGSD